MENQEFEGDHMTTGTSFSQLLFGDDDDEDAGLDLEQTLDCSSVFSTQKIPRMLCFGNYQNDGELLLSEVITSSDFSSPSSCNSSNSSFSSFSKSKVSIMKKRNGSGQECTESVPTAAIGSHRPPKKTKAGKPISNGHAKRTEKLGERIAALQQLVSPFGKTDTASVLHEAMGYIRFLHDQVQVLCSPYLKRLSSSPHHHDHYHHHPPGEVDGKGEAKKELRSKGLCLIPVERTTTIHVANSNGADFWLPAMENNVSSTTKKQ